MRIPAALDDVQTPTAIALGNFDGVHRGHRRVIDPVLALATDGACPTVVTFSPHPQEFFTQQQRPLLTPMPEKAKVLGTIGIEQLVVLPFGADLAKLSPQEFVEQILLERLQVRAISVGEDFRFGWKRVGTTEDLRSLLCGSDRLPTVPQPITLNVVPLCRENDERISSSAIRQALQTGELAIANHLLGRSYTLTGEIVQGQQLGRTIGFPTANLQLPAEKFVPCRGVYAVWVEFGGDETSGVSKNTGVMNIGIRPTVNGLQQTIEVHLLDWSGDLYGKTLTVSLEKFLRPEQKFDSLDNLKTQIQLDCEVARSALSG